MAGCRGDGGHTRRRAPDRGRDGPLKARGQSALPAQRGPACDPGGACAGQSSRRFRRPEADSPRWGVADRRLRRGPSCRPPCGRARPVVCWTQQTPNTQPRDAARRCGRRPHPASRSASTPPHSPPPPSRHCPPSLPDRTSGGVHPEWMTRPTNLPRQPWWGQGEGVCSKNQGGRPPRRAGRGPSCTLEGGNRARRGRERGACTVYSGPLPQHTQPLSPTRDGRGAFGRGTGRGGQRDPPLPRPHGSPSPTPPLALSVWISPHWQWRVPPPPRQLLPPVQRDGPQRPAVLAPCPHYARTPSVPSLPPPPFVPLIPIVRRPPGGHGTVQRPWPRLFEHPSHHARGGVGERKGPHRSRRTVVCAAAGPARLARLPDHPSPPPRHLEAAFLSHPSRLLPLFPPPPPISRVCWSLTHPLPLLASTVSSTIERP